MQHHLVDLVRVLVHDRDDDLAIDHIDTDAARGLDRHRLASLIVDDVELVLLRDEHGRWQHGCTREHEHHVASLVRHTVVIGERHITTAHVDVDRSGHGFVE